MTSAPLMDAAPMTKSPSPPPPDRETLPPKEVVVPRPAERSKRKVATPIAAAATDLHMPEASVHRDDAGITLIPEEFRTTATAPALWPLWVGGAALGLALVLVGGAWMTLSRVIAREWGVVGSLETRRDALRRQLAESERAMTTLRATTRRATVVTTLLPSHRRWEPLFALIEARTIPGVRYEGLTADVNGAINMPTIAPNMRVAAEQMVAWRTAPSVVEATASGLASEVDELGVIRGVRFDLRIRLDPTVFMATPTPSVREGL